MIRALLRPLALCAAAAAAASTAGTAAAPPATTLARTIVARAGGLAYGPGEPYAVREDLARAQPGRESGRSELLFFGQLTDVHIVDEESPARVELLDRYGGSLISAYRPYEGLLTQVADEMVRALRAARSPLDGRPLDLVVDTGDSADNTQQNETDWFVRLLDGGIVDPDSGVAGTCGVRGGGLYHGVDGGAYYDPDGNRDRGAYRRLPNFPGLFDRMNRPFRATGLGIPWYAVVGNHDALIQGNVAPNPIFSQAALGCIKPVALSAATLAKIRPLLAGGLTQDERAQVVKLVTQDVVLTILDPKHAKGRYVRAPSDPRRLLQTKTQFMQQVLAAGGSPAGHGFTTDDVSLGKGYYAFAPRPGLRFVVLDSTSASSDRGNVDDVQLRWLQDELSAAETAHELVVVFAHHPLEAMTAAAPGAHLGAGAPCPTTDPAAAPAADETVECVLLRHRSVIALVTGHEHRNRVVPFPRADGSGGFWQITTAGDVEWPMQSRLLELFDNRDGTLSIFSTMLDQAAPPAPGPLPKRPEPLAGPAEVARLASIARVLAYRDPQADHSRAGTRLDRNVELLVPDPYVSGG